MNENLWLCLPDSLLLNIFSYLSSVDLLRACQSCKHWSHVGHDEFLWKRLFFFELKIDRSLPLRRGCRSYYNEYKRLKYHVPCQQSQVLKEHSDQVLHVSFAHNGTMFASSSKDGTVKVWSAKSPCKVKYSRDMKALFRWQYTQFSQFNISDTLLLVSGVHFGPNSTSGEIAVFNIHEDFSLQSRVLNKPYDTFGAWLNNQYLLSGNLHYLGHFSSCSALWLNKATQEVDSEDESVVMRLFKFLNINASTIRNIMVADSINVNDDADLELGQMCGHYSNSETEETTSCERRKLDENPSETDVSDFTKESGSDVPDSECEFETHSDQLRYRDTEESSDGIVIKFPEGQSSTCSSKREASDVTGLSPPLKARKSEKVDDNAKTGSTGAYLDSDETIFFTGTTKIGDTHFDRVYCRVKMAELRSRPQDIEDETMRALICGVDAVQPSGSQSEQRRTGHLDSAGLKRREQNRIEVDSNLQRAALNASISDNELRSRVGDLAKSRCSSSDTVYSSVDFTGVAMDSSASGDILRSWGKHFNFSSTDSLDEEPSIQYADNKSLRTSTENLSLDSSYGDLDYDDTSSGSNHDNKEHKKKRKLSTSSGTQRSKYLIFSMGTIAYTPHQIGIKRIEHGMTRNMRGSLGSTRKQIQHVRQALAARYHRQTEHQQEEQGEDGDVMEGQAVGHPGIQRDVEFDKVDHVIDIHGHIIGMALSPDNRYLYVNSRSWPKNCVISDPLKPPPISQEIEMHVYDLVTMTEIKRHYGHKAFSSNEELIFIFLDVCDLYVASGAEDKYGYIWDRYYGIQLAKLLHSDVVNSVAFSPRDQEMLVTASDDGTLKVWRSKAMMEQYER
ncbi:F-box/WD repeat-containing protein 5-like [Ptychodera flava]|uniref:F-box/WD repeat-containing protein 5-like n=1 Tax=Ptychodera flava TaxID=63121 RepID=UPI00396A7EEF